MKTKLVLLIAALAALGIIIKSQMKVHSTTTLIHEGQIVNRIFSIASTDVYDSVVFTYSEAGWIGRELTFRIKGECHLTLSAEDCRFNNASKQVIITNPAFKKPFPTYSWEIVGAKEYWLHEFGADEVQRIINEETIHWKNSFYKKCKEEVPDFAGASKFLAPMNYTLTIIEL